MGTNFYLHAAPSVCSACGHDSRPEPIHIGKSSVGWHFSFQTTEYKTEEAWYEAIAALEEKQGWIADEYGKRISLGELKQWVNNKRPSDHCHTQYTAVAGVECVNGVDLCSYEFD